MLFAWIHISPQAVSRGARTPLVVGDMPFGSYEVNPEEALRTAIRFVKVNY